MATILPPPAMNAKTPRPRKVFGRVVTTLDGVVWRLEMRKNGVFVRKNRSRKGELIPLGKIIDLAGGQIPLPL
jgi:hypothetical protein